MSLQSTPIRPYFAVEARLPTKAETAQFVDSASHVGQALQTEALTPESLEQAIKRAGKALEAAQARYEEPGATFDDAAMRDQALRLMYALIAMRTPETVRRMEQERGLA